MIRTVVRITDYDGRIVWVTTDKHPAVVMTKIENTNLEAYGAWSRIVTGMLDTADSQITSGGTDRWPKMAKRIYVDLQDATVV